jgi:hypothetical protein
VTKLKNSPVGGSCGFPPRLSLRSTWCTDAIAPESKAGKKQFEKRMSDHHHFVKADE